MSERAVFADIEWKYRIFLTIKTEKWDPKIFMFNYWNDLVLGFEETYFLEVGAYVSLKEAIAGLWEDRFYWILAKTSQFFKYKNGGVGPKDFTVWLLKWCCLRLSRYMFSGSRYIRVSGMGHHRLLRGSFSLNFSEIIAFF